jgi:alpha-tubulin suppressor-like RCC1 family protein
VRLYLLLVISACGRVGFDPHTAGDGGAGDGRIDAPADAAIGWSHLVAYADQTCALRTGLAYCWGANGSGQLGIGSMTNAPSPAQVALPAGTVQDLAQGESHACAAVGGAIYCWGSATGTTTAMAVGIPGTAVTAGRDFTCVLSGGAMTCWGANSTGQLCVGDTGTHATPTATLLTTGVTAIRAGDDHACAQVSGKAQCCGHNDDGTLGVGSNTPASTPTPLTVIGGITSLPLIAGWHACTLQGGSISCWGEGDNGELGDGGATNTPTPQLVPFISTASVLATGGGPTDRDASCAIVDAGHLECWGNGLYGRLGQGAANPSSTPVAVVGLPHGATEVAIGYDHACAVLLDGSAWCWGRGDLGQLGDGKMTSSLAPVQVRIP